MVSKFRRAASSLDMYRKVPLDLMEGTKRGSLLSYMALLSIATLFFLETKAFFTKRQVTDLALDPSSDAKIRLNFNITMLDLKCDWAVIDVVSALGTDQNVSVHLSKWTIDADGVRQQYGGRNRDQKDIDLHDTTVTETIEELHANGEDAISVDEHTLAYAKKENDYLFVDFYAGWCSHCRDLAPTWEALAELMYDAGEQLDETRHPDDYDTEDYEAAAKVELPVMIAKVDCVHHPGLCNHQEGIRAYPTLRLFVDGKQWKGGDYRGHRTLLEMVEWLYLVEEEHKAHMDDSERSLHVAHRAARDRLMESEDESDEEERKWHDQIAKQKRKVHDEWKAEDHPGCMLSGHLLLDRAPGNFHVQARSQNQEFAAHMTNVSHMVNFLTVGDPMARHMITAGKSSHLPADILEKMSPMDGNVYVSDELHESHHHYLKLISTQVEGFKVGPRELRLYQILENSQLAYYSTEMIPEAKFVYDLSPIAVSYRTESRHWYDYCTSIMAIIGGVFTVVGMFESSIHATVTKAKRRSNLK